MCHTIVSNGTVEYRDLVVLNILLFEQFGSNQEKNMLKIDSDVSLFSDGTIIRCQKSGQARPISLFHLPKNVQALLV